MDTNATHETLPPAEPKSLGSLAQSARGNQLKVARGVLIGIGVLNMAANAFALYNLPNEIQHGIRQYQLPPEAVPEFEQAARMGGYLIYGGAALLGLIFVVFGIILKKFPVAITITSLLLYIGATAGFAALAPATLTKGLIVKIFIVIALFRSIKAARAYEAERKKATFLGEREE